MPYDLDIADHDFREDLSPDQLERLERLPASSEPAELPPLEARRRARARAQGRPRADAQLDPRVRQTVGGRRL